MSQPKVVVVGAGFAGFECARRLARSGSASVSIVNPEDYLLYTPLLPDVAGGVLEPRHAAIPLAEAIPGVRVVRGMATAIDLSGRTATVDLAGRQDDPVVLHWDRLVLTPGSVTKLPDIPGLREHAFGLKTLAQALYLRDHLLGQLEVSVSTDAEHDRVACRTVIVVGASYGGTELIAQLRALADDAARHYRFDRGQVRFLLVDVADAVMPEVGGRLGSRVLDVLRQRGIEVRLGVTLEAVEASSVRLSDGHEIRANTVAWVTGVVPGPLTRDLGVELANGRIVVDDHLRVAGREDVFAAGNAAAVPDPAHLGQPTPPTAQHAVRQGRVLARNVAASLGQGQAKRYTHRNLGLVVDLGPRFAVANPLGLPLSGLPAKALTRAYHLAALPKMTNRLSVGLDYLASAVAPRPLVAMGLVAPNQANFSQSEHKR